MRNRSQRFKPHWCGEVFCRFPLVDCYQNHDLLSYTHVLITQCYSYIHSVRTILHSCYTGLQTDLQRFYVVYKNVIGCCRCSCVYGHWVRHSPFKEQFGFNLQLHFRLFLSFVLLSTLELFCLMVFPILAAQKKISFKLFKLKNLCYLIFLRSAFSQGWWTINLYFLHIFAVWWVQPYNLSIPIPSSVLSIAFIERHS